MYVCTLKEVVIASQNVILHLRQMKCDDLFEKIIRAELVIIGERLF
ncbi:hypothetical protein GCM10028868_32330 [Virgibacillus kimchii]